MKSRKVIEEVYIRIAGSEDAFICTVQCNGIIERAMRYAVAVETKELTETAEDLARRALPVGRPRRRLSIWERDGK